jgi:hypothetical protein
MMVLVDQPPVSDAGQGVAQSRLDALNRAIRAQLTDLAVPSRREGLRWLEIADHAPVTVVQCRPEHDETSQRVPWSLVVRYMVPGVVREDDFVVLDLLPIKTEPAAVWPVPDEWHGHAPVDMTVWAEMIAELARRAPATVPHDLRLGVAAARYHAALMTIAAAKRSVVALADNEKDRAIEAGVKPPSGRDQAYRVGVTAPTLIDWQRTWRGAVFDEHGELIPPDDEDTLPSHRTGVIL